MSSSGKIHRQEGITTPQGKSGGVVVVTPAVSEDGDSFLRSAVLCTESSGETALPPPAPEVVKLDIGGFKFTTSRTTLCRVPGSHLEALFSTRHRMSAIETDDGYQFIDRDGSHFRHVLNFLRTGAVVTLPTDQTEKEELATEADFYGLDALVKAIRMPKMDLFECVPAKTLAHWEAETRLREMFAAGTAKTFTEADPFRGLTPLFPVSGREEDTLDMPLMFDPQSPVLVEGKDTLFMNNLRMDPKDTKKRKATVKNLAGFRTNLNMEFPNVLHRLENILLEEPVIAAGGSVLRALTASKGIRTAEWWNKATNVNVGKSDIDLFLYGCEPEEANRITRRIFYALAMDHETWVVIRGRGVVNIHDPKNFIKIQVVLRIYDSPTEVLVGFDLDCCCCLYNGLNVWVCPRWIAALQTGVNILNTLHAWPKKPSYEFRLAKYAFRGYAVSIPGIDKSRINYDLVHRSKIGELQGLARLLKVASEMETAPLLTSDRSLFENGRWQRQTSVDPSTAREIRSLHDAEREVVSEDLRLIEMLDSPYDDVEAMTQNVLIPSVYKDSDDEIEWLWIFDEFPVAGESRDEAWEEIVDAGSDHPEHLARRLVDAWDISKRSREYLNGQMDKYDLDNLYYSKAYNEGDEDS